MKKTIIECCVETVEEAVTVSGRGCDQIELCSRLDLDGLTPSVELVQQVMAATLAVPLKVMIRPNVREDFIHTYDDIELMKQSIREMKQLGVFGVVFGINERHDDTKLQLNIEAIKELVELARPLNVTIHKAIDRCVDVEREFTRLLNDVDGIDAVLTSGGASTALDGANVLQKLVQLAEESNNTVTVIVAGRVTTENLQLVKESIGGAKAFHGRRIL